MSKEEKENLPEEKQNEEVLRLVFEESKNLRNEFADRLIYNADKIWGLQNVLMVLLGAYITFFTFILGDGKEVFNKSSTSYPMCLCFILLALALFLTLKGIIPKYTLFAPDPKSVYAYIGDDQNKAIKDFIGTYLHHYKETLIRIEEVNTLRKKIIHIEIYSITEFVLSVFIYILDDKYVQLINMFSALLLIVFVADYMDIVYLEKERIHLLIKDINSKK